MSFLRPVPSTVQSAVSLLEIPASRSAPPENDAGAGRSPSRPLVENRPRFDVAKVLWLG